MNAKIQFIKGLDEKYCIHPFRSKMEALEHFDLRIQYLR
jgi:hypothetical protein